MSIDNFENINSKAILKLQDLIEQGKDKEVLDLLSNLHPADIADILDRLNTEEAIYVYRLLDKTLASDVLVELEEDVREDFLSKLNAKELARSLIDDIETDDAADILNEMAEHKKEEVLSLMEDENQASDIVDLLSYEEDSAGGLMAKELIKVQLDWSVKKALIEMRRQAEDIEEIYTIYVVDKMEKLVGTLSLKSLLLANNTLITIDKLYKDDVISITDTSSSEEVSNIMEKYDLVVLPVVNDLEMLVGRITIDDVVDVIKEEAEKDYQLASGISEKVESSDNILDMVKARLPWLLIGLFGGTIAAMVILHYDGQIKINPVFAIFIPLVTATGGNVGVQASAIIVQGLASNTIHNDTMWYKVKKELMVGLTNGLAFSLLILSFNLFLGYTPITFVLSLSLMCVIVFAGIFGTVIPLILDKLNIDPALATGPFITTSNDITGIFIYFYIGTSLLPYFESIL